MSEIILGLGSNMGNRSKMLDRAVSQIKNSVKIDKISSIYQTEPWGNPHQNKFLNLCLIGRTKIAAKDLLKILKTIETDLGRQTTQKWAPRPIDIDILFYGKRIIKQQELRAPHPEIPNRAFVLVPLSEIAPDFIHPELNMSILQLRRKIDVKGVSKYDA